MTLRGKLITLFPLFTLTLAALSLGLIGKRSYLLGFICALTVIYLLPPLVFRIHQWIAPIALGMTRISGPDYSPWWGTHQIQLLFIAIPQLESFLRLIPGFYSAWLRLWGAKIGHSVYWTPRVEIIDRSLIEIGNQVLIGHHVILVSHVIDQSKSKGQILYVKPIKIGNGCFIGAGSVISPGCEIADGAKLDAGTELKLNERR